MDLWGTLHTIMHKDDNAYHDYAYHDNAYHAGVANAYRQLLAIMPPHSNCIAHTLPWVAGQRYRRPCG